METIPAVNHSSKLLQWNRELRMEADALLTWWETYMKDEQQGGFYGKVNNDNSPVSGAPKGIVLNSRILWTFSAACKGDNARRQLADRAYEYIVKHFVDPEFGGVYWSVDASGNPLEVKKQIYGQAFCIYGLAEYYKLSRNPASLELAQNLFHCIEKYSLDRLYGGYVEARDRDWKALADLRLSDKDANEAKSMNTHLHVIEAYCCLYQSWKEAELQRAIQDLLDLFREIIIDSATRHQRLFFGEDWTPRSTAISFGHDIEAAWLLFECAEIAGTPEQLSWFRSNLATMAYAAAEGLDADGGLWHEYDPASGHWIKEKHWWPQAEAMAGFYRAWVVSRDSQFLQHAIQSWEFIKKYLKDTQNGEWFWGVKEDYALMDDQDKAGFWKCPYHHVRACLEIIREEAVK